VDADNLLTSPSNEFNTLHDEFRLGQQIGQQTLKAEVIVQAGADDVAVEARAGQVIGDGEGGHPYCGVRQRAQAKGHAAEVIIKIFDLEAPVG
jgi:hypothetical protein